MRHRHYIPLTIMLFLTFSALYGQNGTRLIGYDAKTIGRGGTVTGFFDNPSLMMNNPGGISFLDATQLDINFSLMAPTVSFQNAYNNTEGKKNYFPLPSLWYVNKPRESKWTYGFGLYTQGGMGADFSLNHPLYKNQQGDYIQQTYHSKFAVMQGGPSVAYQLNKKLAVGVSAHLVYSQMEFQMPYSLSPNMLKGIINPQNGFTFGNMFSAPFESGGLNYSEVTASANMKDLNAFGFAGKIGIAYKATKDLSLGLNYNSPTRLHFKNGKADMDMSAQMNDAFARVMMGILQQNPGMSAEDAQVAAMNNFSQLGIDLSKGAVAAYDLSNTFSLPQSIAFGVSLNATRKIRLGLDVEWINWANAFDKMQLSLSGGKNPNINTMMGNNGSFSIDFPLNWKNTVVIRTGTEFDLSQKLTGRLGYAYGSNPVPAATVFPVFPAIVKHHIMTGLSYRVSQKFAINLAYEHAFKNELKASNPSLIANEFNNSTSGLKTSIYHLSVSWKL
ncbi:MAG: hypothetical protein GC171_14075 [Terrimonas sp.]|nr:hypothetical protein [Terrimonas sp.]